MAQVGQRRVALSVLGSLPEILLAPRHRRRLALSPFLKKV